MRRTTFVISPAFLRDGRCAGGRILTVFSAPDYGGHHKNDAAMVVMSRELHVFPKVLRARGRAAAAEHNWVLDPKRPFTPPRPRPEPGSSRPTSTERLAEDATRPYDGGAGAGGGGGEGGGGGGGGGGQAVEGAQHSAGWPEGAQPLGALIRADPAVRVAVVGAVVGARTRGDPRAMSSAHHGAQPALAEEEGDTSSTEDDDEGEDMHVGLQMADLVLS